MAEYLLCVPWGGTESVFTCCTRQHSLSRKPQLVRKITGVYVCCIFREQPVSKEASSNLWAVGWHCEKWPSWGPLTSAGEMLSYGSLRLHVLFLLKLQEEIVRTPFRNNPQTILFFACVFKVNYVKVPFSHTLVASYWQHWSLHVNTCVVQKPWPCDDIGYPILPPVSKNQRTWRKVHSRDCKLIRSSSHTQEELNNRI